MYLNTVPVYCVAFPSCLATIWSSGTLSWSSYPIKVQQRLVWWPSGVDEPTEPLSLAEMSKYYSSISRCHPVLLLLLRYLSSDILLYVTIFARPSFSYEQEINKHTLGILFIRLIRHSWLFTVFERLCLHFFSSRHITTLKISKTP